ncbi:GOLPH3/VPS74 family protein [Paractinoplanes maris]|uniref:GOLPH3/VPS74 family protein n=1 Tax=Paractinoplanes maris TaxID=1734446 RepID=UPI002021B790|nr:GPP34 family phosphoprotein [Actinoplanes maris]
MMPTADALPFPHQLFLLSVHLEKGRLDADSEPVRGSLFCAAAVAELRIGGLLHDRDGEAGRTNTTTPATLDPFLTEVLGEVPASGSRSWFEVLESRWDKAERAVREDLVSAGHMAIEHRQIFGPFRRKEIVLADPDRVEALREQVRDAALGGSGSASVPLVHAVLATLAVDGLVGTMFRWRELATHRRDIGALADRVEQEMPGLRKALSYSIALRRGG